MDSADPSLVSPNVDKALITSLKEGHIHYDHVCVGTGHAIPNIENGVILDLVARKVPTHVTNCDGPNDLHPGRIDEVSDEPKETKPGHVLKVPTNFASLPGDAARGERKTDGSVDHIHDPEKVKLTSDEVGRKAGVDGAREKDG